MGLRDQVVWVGGFLRVGIWGNFIIEGALGMVRILEYSRLFAICPRYLVNLCSRVWKLIRYSCAIPHRRILCWLWIASVGPKLGMFQRCVRETI